jgi:hypothetical protein
MLAVELCDVDWLGDIDCELEADAEDEAVEEIEGEGVIVLDDDHEGLGEQAVLRASIHCPL